MTDRTYALAVQPAAWENHDSTGCDWVCTMDMARSVAHLWGEPCTVWACPVRGVPFRLCNL